MKIEYVYFLSSYLYISIVNGWLDFSGSTQEPLIAEFSQALCFPLIHITHLTLRRQYGKNNSEWRSVFKFLSLHKQELADKVFEKGHSQLLKLVHETEKVSDDAINKMFSGELFTLFNKDIKAYLSSITSVSVDNRIDIILTKLIELFTFSRSFYEENDSESNKELQRLISSSVNLRRKWKKLYKEYSNGAKKNILLRNDSSELLKSIMKECNSMSVEFMNL